MNLTLAVFHINFKLLFADNFYWLLYQNLLPFNQEADHHELYSWLLFNICLIIKSFYSDTNPQLYTLNEIFFVDCIIFNLIYLMIKAVVYQNLKLKIND